MDAFPDKYKGGMFIAHHGSWNRDQKIGYQVVFTKVDGDKVT
jgi:glucose/arabinose dehydrogenase